MTQDELKALVGRAALDYVVPGTVVGVGTGSTVNCFIDALATIKDRIAGAVSSSVASTLRLQAHGITVLDSNTVQAIPVYIDGADEIDHRGCMIKGGGAALLREKLVWEASSRCIVIADAAKVVPVLGAFPLPIEVVAFGHKTTANRIADVLIDHDINSPARVRQADRGLVRTDGGNLIYDAACKVINDPARLAADLKSLTGVVEHGLFLDLTDLAIIGTDEGFETINP